MCAWLLWCLACDHLKNVLCFLINPKRWQFVFLRGLPTNENKILCLVDRNICPERSEGSNYIIVAQRIAYDLTLSVSRTWNEFLSWFGAGSLSGSVFRCSGELPRTAKQWHAMALRSGKFLKVYLTALKFWWLNCTLLLCSHRVTFHEQKHFLRKNISWYLPPSLPQDRAESSLTLADTRWQ